MPISELTQLGLKSFFNTGSITSTPLGSKIFGKSIQRNNRFTVSIYDNPIPTPNKLSLYKRVGPMPLIRGWHVSNVSVPQYDMKKEVQYYGPFPRSFPQMEYDGLEVKVEFEEDDKGTIGHFINWMQRSIVDEDGIYTPPDLIKIPIMVVTTLDDTGLPVGIFIFHDLYYLAAGETQYSYDGNLATKYNVTFNCDRMVSFFPKKMIVSGAARALAGLGEFALGLG